MESPFAKRFAGNQKNSGLETGIPVNKEIKLSQVHRNFTFSNAAMSVVSNTPVKVEHSKFDADTTFYSVRNERSSRTKPSKTICPLNLHYSLQKPDANKSRTPRIKSLSFNNAIKPFEEVCLTPKHYYRLGGLGPNIGSNEWMIARQKCDRQRNYAKLIRDFNVFKNASV